MAVAERYKFAEVEHDGKQFINDLFKQSKVHGVGNLTTEVMMKLGNKDVVAKYLASALQLIERQHNMVINQRVHISSYKNDIIKLQSSVIAAQAKALRSTEDVEDAIQASVQSGFKSFSEAVGSTSSSTVISPGTLKSVAKQVVIEEELSRNVMVFGLSEENDEDICASVGKVFEQLGEKPKIEARRLGSRASSTPRPVKVVLTSAATVQQILSKSRKLRDSQYKSVFLTPDRTAEQRAEHRQLVLQLKKKGVDEPARHHYIIGGQICSTELKHSKDSASKDSDD